MKALLQEMLDQRLLYRDRAARRHGVDRVQHRNIIGGEPELDGQEYQQIDESAGDSVQNVKPETYPVEEPKPIDEEPANTIEGNVEEVMKKPVMPPPERYTEGKEPQPQPDTQVEPLSTLRERIPWWAKTLGAAVIGAATGGAGLGFYQWLSQPVVIHKAADVIVNEGGDLLDFLEDQGYHVPPGDSDGQ